MADVLGAGVQLAVGKGTGAPLAELDVAGEVQFSGGPEPLHVGGAVLHLPAPLQQDGPGSGPGQHQGGEQPRRTGSHYDGGDLRRGDSLGELVNRPGLRPGDVLVPAAAEDGGLVGHFDLHHVDHADALPGVDAAAENVQRQQGLLPDMEDTEYLGAEGGGAAAGGEFQIFDAQHSRSSQYWMGVLYHSGGERKKRKVHICLKNFSGSFKIPALYYSQS